MRDLKFVIVLNIFVLILGNSAFAGNPDVVSVKNDLYELYAPNKKELKTAEVELNFAASQFARYFGEKPPKIAVYIVNSPEEVPNIDFGSFSKRGLKVLPFITNEYMQKLKNPNDTKIGLAEAKVLSHEAGHKYLITYVNKKIPNVTNSLTNPKYGHPAIPDWFDEAFATLCEFTILKEHRYDFLNKNLDKTIPLMEFFNMEHPVFAKSKGEHFNSSSSAENKKTLSKEEIEKLLKNKPANTKMMTDGEAAELLKKNPGKARVLSKEEAENFLKRIPAGAKITIKTSDGITTDRDIMFYSQSLAFSDYLIEKYGNLIIKKLADGLIEGATIDKILNKNSDIQKIETEWKEWVKQKR